MIHHLESKDALRVACDEHVAATIRERKQAAMAAGSGLDPVVVLRAWDGRPALLRHLARTLVDGTPQVAALVDELVADAGSCTADGVTTGLSRPTQHPDERAALLTVWSLGAVVLHEHVQRLLGASLVGSERKAGS